MRWSLVPLLLALAACHVGPVRPVEPVVLETSFAGGAVEAGAIQGIGATLVNRSRTRIYHVGVAGITAVRLSRVPSATPRRADVPADSTRPLGDYWERAYHLAYAAEPGTTQTLVLPIETVEARGRLALAPVRFSWPRDPGEYSLSVCSSYSLGDAASGREVCARPVRVEVR